MRDCATGLQCCFRSGYSRPRLEPAAAILALENASGRAGFLSGPEASKGHANTGGSLAALSGASGKVFVAFHACDGGKGNGERGVRERERERAPAGG